MALKYHGWIVKEKTEGFTQPLFVAELRNEKDERIRPYSSSDPANVIDWWDRRVGEPVKLISTPLGAFRVCTGEED